MLLPSLQPDAGLEEQRDKWSARGLRVLFFAYQPIPLPLRDALGQPRLPSNLVPLGALSLSDELRPEAQATLKGFAEANIQLKIISGDSPHTVAALAKQAGLAGDVRAVSGLELKEMDDTRFAQAASEATIFGRITPRQKEELVRALRTRGYYVAMIGDGVNDVLSLKQAQLGWRPTFLALGMLGLFALAMAIPALRGFFELAPVRALDLLVIAAVVAVWAIVLRFAWRARLFERLMMPKR
jgi:cation-transporting ATPase E